jgi:hypothetical protein
MTSTGKMQYVAATLIAALLLYIVTIYGFDAVAQVTLEQIRIPSDEQLRGPPTHKLIVPMI